jgi:hypothetical protein
MKLNLILMLIDLLIILAYPFLYIWTKLVRPTKLDV